FGPLKKPDRKLPNTYTEEPAQDGERQVVLRRVGAGGATGVVYHIPAGGHDDFAPVPGVADFLTPEPAARGGKGPVGAKKAASVSGSAYAWHDPGVIEITAKVENPAGVDAARDALIETIENLAKNPITEEEVTRSKQRFQKFNEQLLAASDRLAIQLSERAGAGDWRLFFLDRDRVEKVTAADVNKAAAKYLTRTNRTVGVYYPTEKAERAHIPTAPQVAKLLDGYKGRGEIAAGEAFDPTPDN